MARPRSDGATATADKPTRQRKSAEERKAARLARLEKRLGRVLILIADLVNLKKLSEAQEDYIVTQINEYKDKLDAAFSKRRETVDDSSEEIHVHMPD